MVQVPRVSRNVLLAVSIGIVAIGFVYWKDITKLIDQAMAFLFSWYGLVILGLIYVAWQLSQRLKERVIWTIEDPHKVLRFCCENLDAFRDRRISEDTINWDSVRNFTMNNNMLINFQPHKTESTWLLIRIAPTMVGYRPSAIDMGYMSFDTLEKLCRDNSLENAIRIVSEQGNVLEEIKKEVGE